AMEIRSRQQHDLAEHFAGGEVLVRRACVRKREGAVHDRLEPAGEDVLQDIVQLAHGSHVGAQNRKLTGVDKAEVNANLRTGGCATGDEGPGGHERAQALFPGGDADVLHDDVHSLLVGDAANFV